MKRYYKYNFYTPLFLRPLFKDFLIYTQLYNTALDIEWSEKEYLLGSLFEVKICDETIYAGIFVNECHKRLLNW